MRVDAFRTTFQNPVLLAAGTAGFGREVAGVIDLDRLGGLVTKAVSPEPRSGNPAPRVAEFDGGMLNSVGLANPGVTRVREQELPWLASHLRHARVLVNVVGSRVDDYVTVIETLTDHDVVTAFELNVSCPNTDRGGEEFGVDDGVLQSLVSRCRAATSRPLVVKLAPTLPDPARSAALAIDAGAEGITVINTVPGVVREWRAGRWRPRLGAGRGGVSGPALLPVGVLAVERVRAVADVPIIGVGGVRTAGDLRQYLDAGATLVAIGTAALADPRVPIRIVREWVRGREGR